MFICGRLNEDFIPAQIKAGNSLFIYSDSNNYKITIFPYRIYILIASMQKKLPFGVKIIKKAVLLKMIEDWFTALDIDYFVHQQYFKFFPRFIIDLDKDFTINCIKYAILKRFPLLVQENSQEDLIVLSSKIKESYALININIIMKLDSYFYFLSIFLTKTITQFLRDTFGDIDIQKNLESQMYIVLVFVIIGLEVAPKTYMINHKKIIYEKYLQKSKPKSLCRFQTIQGIPQRGSISKIPPCKGLKKLIIERKWTNISCREELVVTPLDEFRESLKENLTVKALPKLVKKKIKGCDFDYNADKYEAQMKGDQRKYIFLRESDAVSQPFQAYINSNQNSTSFQQLLENTTQNQLFIHRNVKISHRAQILMNTKNARTEKKLKSANNTPEKKNREYEGQKGNKNWKNIIKEIRQHALQTNKINNFIQTSSASQFTERKTQFQSHRTSENACLKEVQPQSEPKQCTFMPKTINFGSYWIHERQQPFSGQQNDARQEKNIPKTHKLRRQRHFFDKSCEKRHHQAHYSMFSITHSPQLSLHM